MSQLETNAGKGEQTIVLAKLYNTLLFNNRWQHPQTSIISPVVNVLFITMVMSIYCGPD